MKDTDIIAAIAPDAVSLMDKAIAEIKRLRQENATLTAERDEARRMYCESVILHGTAHRFDANGVPEEITDATEFARTLRWDCYKENTDAQGQ